MPTRTVRRSYRAIFLSDCHLGTRAAQAGPLSAFLAGSRCRFLYLVGDIVDLEAMRRSVYWDRHHQAVVTQVLEWASRDTAVVYIPGNHDDALRAFAGRRFGEVLFARDLVHETKDGRRLLVTHGDEFDSVVRHSALGHALGSRAYDLVLWLSRALQRARTRLGLRYWSLAGYLKGRLPHAGAYIERFHQAASQTAAQRGVDGIICGHIHRAALHDRDTYYANTGDWVESCSALVEHEDGRLELIHWRQEEPCVTAFPLRRLPMPVAAEASRKIQPAVTGR